MAFCVPLAGRVPLLTRLWHSAIVSGRLNMELQSLVSAFNLTPVQEAVEMTQMGARFRFALRRSRTTGSLAPEHPRTHPHTVPMASACVGERLRYGWRGC